MSPPGIYGFPCLLSVGMWTGQGASLVPAAWAISRKSFVSVASANTSVDRKLPIACTSFPL